MTISVLIADDHSLVRQGLRRYLEMAGDIRVVGEASTGREVLGLMEDGGGQPDIVLLDIRMPEMDGLEAARRILNWSDRVVVFLLSTYEATEYASWAAGCGAAAYITKAELGPRSLARAWEEAARAGPGRTPRVRPSSARVLPDLLLHSP